MELLFVTDFVCPYCIVAKEAIKKVLREYDMGVEFKMQPFELTVEPKEQVDTWNDPVRREHYKVLVEPAKELGLDVKLPPHVVPRPYTRLAFEGWYYACEEGVGDTYAALVYAAYFTEEQDIGNVEVLAAIAGKAGLDPEAFKKVLAQGTYREQQQEANRYCRQTLGITHVPTIYLDGKEVELKAYTPDEVMRVLVEKRAEDAGETVFFGCGEDGC